MASASCKPGLGKGSWCWGQTALKTNEVFIWEVGRLKCTGLCPWIPSVRIPETLEKRRLVLAWLWQARGLLNTEEEICPSVDKHDFFFFFYSVWVYFSMDGCLIHDNISNNIYVIRWLHLKIICLFLRHLCILNMHLFLTTVCKSVVYKVFSQYKIKGKQQCETLLLSQQSILTIIFHKAGLDYYSWQATILIFRMEHCIYFYPLISNKVSYLHSSQTKVVLHDTLGWELMQHLCD